MDLALCYFFLILYPFPIIRADKEWEFALASSPKAVVEQRKSSQPRGSPRLSAANQRRPKSSPVQDGLANFLTIEEEFDRAVSLPSSPVNR